MTEFTIKDHNGSRRSLYRKLRRVGINGVDGFQDMIDDSLLYSQFSQKLYEKIQPLRLPNFCYEKAFWIMLGIMVTLMTSITGVAWGLIIENQERSIINEKTLAERSQNIQLIPRLYENQIIMCTALDVSCKQKTLLFIPFSKWYLMLEIPLSRETIDNRIVQDLKSEAFCSWADHSPKYLKRGVRLNPGKDNVIRVLTKPEGNDFIKQFDYTHNIVTDDGEIFYAKQGAGETPATNEDFAAGRFELGTTAYSEAETDTFNEFDVSGTSKISGSRKVFTATYPKTNDTGDADNTGDAVDAVSYAVSYTTGDFNDNDIEQGTIHDNASPVGATKLLCVWSFTSFAKTASDTLKVFVNHSMESVQSVGSDAKIRMSESVNGIITDKTGKKKLITGGNQ